MQLNSREKQVYRIYLPILDNYPHRGRTVSVNKAYSQRKQFAFSLSGVEILVQDPINFPKQELIIGMEWIGVIQYLLLAPQ